MIFMLIANTLCLSQKHYSGKVLFLRFCLPSKSIFMLIPVCIYLHVALTQTSLKLECMTVTCFNHHPQSRTRQNVVVSQTDLKQRMFFTLWLLSSDTHEPIPYGSLNAASHKPCCSFSFSYEPSLVITVIENKILGLDNLHCIIRTDKLSFSGGTILSVVFRSKQTN